MSGFRAFYVATAVVVLNILLLALALDGAWSVVHRWRHPYDPVKGVAHAMLYDYADVMPRVYPGRSPETIRALLLETWSRPYQYEAYTGFRETPMRGRFVNISADGFRGNGRPQPWPPPRSAVFVFGGSTTFGYGL